MNYKGFEIRGIFQTYSTWSLNDKGKPIGCTDHGADPYSDDIATEFEAENNDGVMLWSEDLEGIKAEIDEALAELKANE